MRMIGDSDYVVPVANLAIPSRKDIFTSALKRSLAVVACWNKRRTLADVVLVLLAQSEALS
jgi:hypothetical protein